MHNLWYLMHRRVSGLNIFMAIGQSILIYTDLYCALFWHSNPSKNPTAHAPPTLVSIHQENTQKIFGVLNFPGLLLNKSWFKIAPLVNCLLLTFCYLCETQYFQIHVAIVAETVTLVLVLSATAEDAPSAAHLIPRAQYPWSNLTTGGLLNLNLLHLPVYE